MTEFELFGWNFKQWAIAFGRITPTEINENTALETKEEWMMRYQHEPEDNIIANCSPNKRYDLASQLIDVYAGHIHQ